MKRKGELIRDIVSDVFRLAILFVVFGVSWHKDQWFNDQTKELIFGIVTGLIFLFISFIGQPFARPVKISMNMKNSQYGREETTFSIKGKRRTQEFERTVAMEIEVRRRYSVFGVVVLWLLRNRDVDIVVESVTRGIILQAESEQSRSDLESTTTGFKVKVGDYIGDILRHTDDGEFKKGCKFVIIENPHYRVSEEKFQIYPILTNHSQRVPFWLPLLLQFESNKHVVHFTHE